MYTKYLGVAMTLAIAVLSLGYANPASADPPECPGEHPSCDAGTGGNAGSAFDVDVVPLDMNPDGNWVVASGCVGERNNNRQTLSVNVSSAGSHVCGGVMIETVPYYLFAIGVSEKRGTVRLWFTDDPVPNPVENENVHSSAVTEATILADVGGLSFVVTVDRENVQVSKTHRPNKGPVGTIKIGEIQYTSID